MKDEVVEKVLGLDIKVQTNNGNEKLIRFTDIRNCENAALFLNHDDLRKKIKLMIECIGYSIEIIDV